MLSAVLQHREAEEEADGLMEAVHVTPNNVALQTHPTQALQDLETARAAVLALEVDWGFCPPSAPSTLVRTRVIVMEI
jgi:hypothetical protein